MGEFDIWMQIAPDWIFSNDGDRQQTWAAGESLIIEENTWKSGINLKGKKQISAMFPGAEMVVFCEKPRGEK